MSTAAPGISKLTNGFAAIPNSLIENQSLFTRAEFALALIVLRRGASADEPMPVSDRNWEKWTGLGARQKEYAIAGLKKKGLEIIGRGDNAKYRWARDMWEAYAREAEREAREARAKTERKITAVPAKKGAMVHPECAGDGGCSMLRGASTPAALLVMPRPSMPGSWPETLAVVRSWFPMVGVPFIQKLAGVCASTVGPVNDAELANGVRVAYAQKKRAQNSEGLFLHTVPEAIAAVRSVKLEPKDVEFAIGTPDLVRDLITRVLGAMESVARVSIRGTLRDTLVKTVEAAAALAPSDELESSMERAERDVYNWARGFLTPAQSDKVESDTHDACAMYAKKMSPEQREQFAARARVAATLAVLKIPRVSLFHA